MQTAIPPQPKTAIPPERSKMRDMMNFIYSFFRRNNTQDSSTVTSVVTPPHESQLPRVTVDWSGFNQAKVPKRKYKFDKAKLTGIFSVLPSDIIIHVLSFVHFHDIVVKISELSRGFYMLSQSQKLWKQLYLQLYLTLDLTAVQNPNTDWQQKFLTMVPNFFPIGLTYRTPQNARVVTSSYSITAETDNFFVQSSGVLSSFKRSASQKCCYYEITVLKMSESIQIGLSGIMRPVPHQIKRTFSSVSQDGKYECGELAATMDAPLLNRNFKIREKDIVGVGIDEISNNVFYTLNGKFVLHVFSNVQSKMIAGVMLKAGDSVSFNFGLEPFRYPLEFNFGKA